MSQNEDTLGFSQTQVDQQNLMSIMFKGYAIISADGWIADAAGAMPDALRIEADWVHFQNALDAADVTLMGRHTHEAAPNVRQRRRLVVSRSVRAMLKEHDGAWWVNADHVTPQSAATVVSGSTAEVAVVGGTGVFSWILDDARYQEFHLSVAHDVHLGVGVPLLNGAVGYDQAIQKLEGHGLVLKERRWLDQSAGLELLVFSGSEGAEGA